MCFITARNQLTQWPSSTSCRQVKTEQLKLVLRSVPSDCNQIVPINTKTSSSWTVFFFNMRQCTKSRQSVLLSAIYHSPNPVLFITPSASWLVTPTYSTSILSVRFCYQNIFVLVHNMHLLIYFTIFYFSTLTIINDKHKLWSSPLGRTVYHKLLTAWHAQLLTCVHNGLVCFLQ
jgi:hypothetical protein